MKYLIIAPHADDELLGCGGTVSKLLRSGEEVYLLVCSTRQNDLAKYKDIFSLFTDYYELPFEDEKLHKYNLLKAIEPIYNKIKPDTHPSIAQNQRSQPDRSTPLYIFIKKP